MQPGHVIADRFEVLRTAGSGGMGVVYRAHDRVTGGAVALKVLQGREQGPTDRFAQEVLVLSTIAHPNIVGYVNHGVTADGAPYLVMPWLEGMDLQQRLAAGPLSIDDTITIARCVADALACLHARGLVHRDLKPSNLFLPAGQVSKVQVIDFGIARESVATRSLTVSGVLIGTPGFIAPEQARGDHDVAPTVDIFSFGCVLFECLTGERLFGGAHLMAVLAKILVEDARRVREIRPEVPNALDVLVHRMVAKEPEKRPRDGAQLAEWIAALGAPVLERPHTPANALTANERRVVSVLVVVNPPQRGTVRPHPHPHPHPSRDETRVEADAFRSSSGRFGVRLHLLADRTAIVLAPEGLSAGDQAAVLARFAHHVADTFPGASIALTTGSAITGARLPVGEAIDRAVTMVRAGTPSHGVHVDDVTAALITSRFDVRRVGDEILVEDERLSLDPTRPLLGRPTSCVGRERELAVLETMLAECEMGNEATVVLVTATPGAGKSRLRHELVRRLNTRAREAPPKVLLCRGDPLHLATPYAMMAQVVRQAVGLREREPPESVREKLFAHVGELVGEVDARRVNDFLGELVGAPFDDHGHVPLRAARGDAAAMADQVRLAFEEIVLAWCARQTLVIVLEDLHWGDAASVKLLDGALRKLAGSPLFVLALARPEVHERFPVLFQNRGVTELRLPPLPKRASMKLVEEAMGDGARTEDVGRIVERSEGNAFFLEELIRAAAEHPGMHNTPPPSSRRDDLPQTVIAVAQARLERLEPKVRKVLRAASIFGDVFWLEGVSALLGDAPEALAPIVDSLIEQEAIVAAEQPRLAGVRELGFRHTLLCGAAYATLTEGDRTLGHRLAATWLEQVDEDAEVVAMHWLEGGDRARAADRFTHASEARWRRAHADAAARCAARALLVCDATTETDDAISTRVRLLATALKATRHIDSRDVMMGLERHVPPLGASAARTAAHAAIERALAPFRAGATPGARRAFPTVLADAACALGAISDFAEAKKLVAEASAAADEDATQTRTVRSAAARIAFWCGELGASMDIASDTLLPENPRERLEMFVILAIATSCVDGREALGRALDFVNRGEALLAAQSAASDGVPDATREDPVMRVQLSKARHSCFYFAGEYATGLDAAEAALALARQAGLRFEECALLHNAGEFCLRLGDRDRARVALVASSAIARDIGDPRSQKHNDILFAYLDASAERLSQMAEAARSATDPWQELHSRFWLGHLLASTRAPDARRSLERARELAGQLKVRTMANECAQAIAGLPE
jgi:serine/threonine protein kinase